MGIATVGDNCMDVYHQSSTAYPGGNPVNVAVYTRRLGGQASYVGVVGTDAYGTQMQDALQRKGVDISHLRVVEGQTAVSQVLLQDGERVFGDYDEGVMADFRPSQDEIAFLCTHKLVMSGLWGHAEGALPEIKKAGVPVAFDFADRPRDPVVDRAIGYVDYAFFSCPEGENAEELLYEMHRRGPKVVVVTQGAQGSMAYDGNILYRQGITPCTVVDTMGAGDSFIAGFLFGILRGDSIQDSMALGAKTSSETIGYQGAW